MNEQVEALLRTLPRKVKVGAYDWRIKIEEGENEDLGNTVWETYRILIWPEMFPSPEHAVGTILHEILHVIHDNEDICHAQEEEDIVSGFEVGLISVFRDNPRLLTWIKKGLKQSN